MVTPAEAAAYRDAQRDVVTLARAALADWWRDLDVSDAKSAVSALESFIPDLVAAYGDVAATVAADWYDALRGQAGVPGSYRARLAEPLPDEQVRASARWAAEPLFARDPDSERALRLMAQAVQRLVQQRGRDTMTRNVRSDPSRPRWMRVPHGRTCAFCLMLASRGPVYLSAQTAGAWNRYHDACDCQPMPYWQGQGLPYDPDELYSYYLAAREVAGGDTRAILAQLRKDLDIN